jgi:hypothetical protein
MVDTPARNPDKLGLQITGDETPDRPRDALDRESCKCRQGVLETEPDLPGILVTSPGPLDAEMLPTGRSRRFKGKKWFFHPALEQGMFDLPCEGTPTIAVKEFLASGGIADHLVERHDAGAGIESNELPPPRAEGRDIRHSTDVQEQHGALAIREKGPVCSGNERGTLAAGRDVCHTKIMNGRDARPDRDLGALTELERKRSLTVRGMPEGLAMARHRIDLVGPSARSRQDGLDTLGEPATE